MFVSVDQWSIKMRFWQIVYSWQMFDLSFSSCVTRKVSEVI
jgi:hypothetical protein